MIEWFKMKYLKKGMDCTEKEIKVKGGNKEFVAVKLMEMIKLKLMLKKILIYFLVVFVKVKLKN